MPPGITVRPKAPRGQLNKKATPKSKAAAQRLNDKLNAEPRLEDVQRVSDFNATVKLGDRVMWVDEIVTTTMAATLQRGFPGVEIYRGKKGVLFVDLSELDVFDQTLVAGVDGPPSHTSTSLPDGIAALDRHARAAAADARRSVDKVELGPIIRLRRDWLDRHPNNRIPGEDEIVALTTSMDEKGQLEPLVVREWSGSKDRLCQYQILSGETRWRSGGMLEWTMLDCRIVQGECDDALALELLALYNGKRADLNPIEKAKLVAQLGKPIAAGGAAYTREQAAAAVGLKHGASASNLLRLLELPQVWQDRVAKGELPESFARVLVTISQAPRLMELLEKDWEEHLQALEDPENNSIDDNFKTRDDVENCVYYLVKYHTRPVEPDQKHQYDHDHFPGNYALQGNYAILFDVEAHRDQLEIFDLPLREWHEGERRTEVLPRATNVELYDKHQVPAIKKLVKGNAKQGAASAAKKDDKKLAAKPELTPAQKKAKDKERAEQLKNRINAWRHRWLCALVSESIASNEQAMLSFAAWLLAGGGGFHDHDLAEAAVKQLGYKPKDHHYELEKKLWKLVAYEATECELGCPALDALLAMCRFALGHVDKDPKYLKLADVIDDLANWCELKLDLQWKVLQAMCDTDGRLEEFLELHNGDQLDALGKELDVYVAGQKTKGAKIQAFRNAPRALAMPKAIGPLPTPRVKSSSKPAAKKKVKASK